MQTVVEPDAVLSHGLASAAPGVNRGKLATTLSITTDDVLSVRIGKRSECETENLEAFSVALACASLSVPFAAVLAVTNVVGAEGREQWGKHRRKAADLSARLVLDWIHRGAKGLPAR
jgi:nucleoside phosphorylase